jgi:hypothetical protein
MGCAAAVGVLDLVLVAQYVDVADGVPLPAIITGRSTSARLGTSGNR